MFNPIKHCDVVFLSYAEPNKDINWSRVKSLCPKAIRVDGVRGFDAAHHAVAEASTTDFVLLIDGDNWLVDDFIYDCMLPDEISDLDDFTVINFRSINTINKLVYENGGVKLWPRHLLANLKSHENAETPENAVDFCYSKSFNYTSSSQMLSITVQSSSPAQAFCAGFREAIKQSLNHGVKFESFEEFSNVSNVKLKREKLFALLNIGSSVENGIWSIYGARLGLCNLWFNKEFDISRINNIDELIALQMAFGHISNLTQFIESSYDVSTLEQKLDVPFLKIDPSIDEFIENSFKQLVGIPFSNYAET